METAAGRNEANLEECSILLRQRMTHYGRQANTVHGRIAGWSASTPNEIHLVCNTVIILSGPVILLIDLRREQVNGWT